MQIGLDRRFGGKPGEAGAIGRIAEMGEDCICSVGGGGKVATKLSSQFV